MNTESTITFENGCVSFLNDHGFVTSYYHSHVCSVETHPDAYIVIGLKDDLYAYVNFQEGTDRSVLNKVHRAIVTGGRGQS